MKKNTDLKKKRESNFPEIKNKLSSESIKVIEHKIKMAGLQK